MTAQQARGISLAHIRLRVPDLNMMKLFLDDFGLITSAQTEKIIYSHASENAGCVHVEAQNDWLWSSCRHVSRS